MRLAVLLVILAVPGSAAAQLVPSDTLRPPPNTETVDIRAFRFVYEGEGPAFVTTMQQANSVSVKLFVAAVPVSALATLAAGGDWDPTLRLAASTAGAVGLAYAAKNLVQRPRPYAGLEGVRARVYVPPPEEDPDPYSFPSGHAATAFALATSTSLSYPRWYVIAPAYAWAAATSLARVWHGVHYPSDTLAGAALGTGAAVLVYLFLPEVDGEDELEAAGATPPALTLRLAF